MAGYEGHRGWINYLAVAKECRKQGIGRWLMGEAEARLRAAGCPKISLQIRSSNAEAVAFYRSLGFSMDDMVSMGKRLIPDDPNRREVWVSLRTCSIAPNQCPGRGRTTSAGSGVIASA